MERGGMESQAQSAPIARWLRHAPLALGLAGWVAVLAVAVSRARGAAAFPAAGLDLAPLRDAGRALADGRSIYAVHNFVYPPPAALVGWALSHLSFHTAVELYSYLEVVVLSLTVLLLRRYLRPLRWQLLTSALVTLVLLKGDLLVSILWLDNASVLLVLPCAWLLVRWSAARWTSGAVVLGLTLLLKPVLVPLIVILLVFRRWKETAIVAGVSLTGLVVCLPLISGSGSLVTVAHRLAGGSNLQGDLAVYNCSLAGIGSAHHVAGLAVGLARVGVTAATVIILVQVARVERPPSAYLVGSLSGLLLSAVFLAGPLGESHYLLLLIPGAILCVGWDSWPVRGLLLAALLAAGFPSFYFGGHGGSASDLQVRAVLIEGLLFTASAVVALAVCREHRVEPGDPDPTIPDPALADRSLVDHNPG